MLPSGSSLLDGENTKGTVAFATTKSGEEDNSNVDDGAAEEEEEDPLEESGQCDEKIALALGGRTEVVDDGEEDEDLPLFPIPSSSSSFFSVVVFRRFSSVWFFLMYSLLFPLSFPFFLLVSF